MLGPGNQEVMLFLQSPPARPGNPLQADPTANLFVITHTHILTPVLMLTPHPYIRLLPILIFASYWLSSPSDNAKLTQFY